MGFNMNMKFEKTQLYLTILIFALAALAFTPLKLLSLLSVVVLLAIILPLKDSFFVKLLLSYVVYFASNTVLGSIFWILHIPASSTSFTLIQLSIIVCLFIVNRPTLKETRFCLSDITKIIISILLIGIIAIPPLFKDLSIFSIVASGGDNLSHIELFFADVTSRGYFYASPTKTSTLMTVQLAGYPQGLHINMFLLSDALKPFFDITSSPKPLISFYYLYTVALFVLFGWMFILIAKVSKKISAVSIAVALVLFSGIFFSLFSFGFQTQIASYILLLSLFFVLERLYEPAYTDKKRQILALLAALITAAVSFTWMFLLPVVLLFTTYILVDAFKLWKFSVILKRWKFILILAAVGIFSVIQPAVQLLYSNKALNSGVNEMGSTVIIPVLVISGIAVLSCLYFIIYRAKRNRVLTAALTISVVFSGIIYAYQVIQVGEPRYYFYKSIFTILIISSVLLTRFCVLSIPVIARKNLANYTSLLILAFGFFIAAQNLTSTAGYFKKHKAGGISPELTQSAVRSVVDNPSSAGKVIAIGSCNREQDYVTTRMVAVISQSNNSSRTALQAGMLEPDRETLIDSIAEYQMRDNTDLTIYSTDNPTSDAVKDRLKGGRNETFVDLDFGHVKKNKYTCPNAAR